MQSLPPASEPSAIKLNGTVVNSRYVVEGLVNSGDYADTYLCTSLVTWDKVVIKFLRHAPYTETTELRFYREFSSAYQVRHRNVICVLELLKHKGFPALVMEYAPKGDLASRLAQGPRFTFAEVVRIASEICQGLKAIHDAGIVHRDLKPENMFIGAEDEVKIGDFGISHMWSERRLTRDDNLLGTACYMSPEYIESGVVDYRSDIYAVGVIMFEMLTGKLPFGPINNYGDLSQIFERTERDPRSLRPDVPEQLALAVKKAMSRDRGKRHDSIGMLLDDIIPPARVPVKFSSDGNPEELGISDTQIITKAKRLPFLS